jgi:hypothetical protein
MTLITKGQTEQLFANGIAQRAAIDRQDQALDFKPVVKLFTRELRELFQQIIEPLETLGENPRAKLA